MIQYALEGTVSFSSDYTTIQFSTPHKPIKNIVVPLRQWGNGRILIGNDILFVRNGNDTSLPVTAGCTFLKQ